MLSHSLQKILIRFIIIGIQHSFLLSSQLTLLSHLLPSFKISCAHYSWTDHTASPSLCHDIPLTFSILLCTYLFYLKRINSDLRLILFFIFQSILSLKYLIIDKAITCDITSMRHGPTTNFNFIRYLNLLLGNTFNSFNILKYSINLSSIQPESILRWPYLTDFILRFNPIIQIISILLLIFLDDAFFVQCWGIWFLILRDCVVLASYRKVSYLKLV